MSGDSRLPADPALGWRTTFLVILDGRLERLRPPMRHGALIPGDRTAVLLRDSDEADLRNVVRWAADLGIAVMSVGSLRRRVGRDPSPHRGGLESRDASATGIAGRRG